MYRNGMTAAAFASCRKFDAKKRAALVMQGLKQQDPPSTVGISMSFQICVHVIQVFDAKDWDALVMRSIVPKLAWALQDVLVINPLQQDLDPFHWVTTWQPVLPQHHMVNLLEFRFFPAWQRVLQHWLSNSPNFDEVTRWYLGWKVSQLALSGVSLF